jgi:RNA polymerase-interacting CarD/CdnL/TRCF family regulator
MYKKIRFEIGDNVIHSAHGVGKIVKIETRQFGVKPPVELYIIEIPDHGAVKKVFVPTENAAQKLSLN